MSDPAFISTPRISTLNTSKASSLFHHKITFTLHCYKSFVDIKNIFRTITKLLSESHYVGFHFFMKDMLKNISGQFKMDMHGKKVL